MPGFDGTGPMGQGPLTGRGRGYCALPLGQAAPMRATFAASPTPYCATWAPSVGMPYYGPAGMGYPFFWGRPRFGGRRGFGRRGGRRRRW